MPKFSEFTSQASPADTDQVVGLRSTTNSRFTLAAIKALFNSVANTAGKAPQRDSEGSVTVSGVQLDTAATPTPAEGMLQWDANAKALQVGVSATESLTVGEEMTPRYRNATGETLTQGTVVYVNGATGSNTTVAKAQANALSTCRGTIGIVTDDAGIANGSRGRICTLGRSNNHDTSAWAEGTALWLSPTVAGGLTSTEPTTEGHFKVLVGTVERQHATQGVINVDVHFYGSVTGDAVANATSQAAARAAIGVSFPVEDWMALRYSTPPEKDIPTITQATGDSTALSSPVSYRPYICGTGVQITNSDGQGDTIFRFDPGNYRTQNGGSADLAMYGEVKPGGDAQVARWPVIATFVTGASNTTVEVAFYSLINNDTLMPVIEVNGRVLNNGRCLRRSVTGNGWKFTMVFPSAGSRTIRLYCAGEAGFEAVRVPTSESITKPTDAVNRMVAIIGDSFTGGALGPAFGGGAADRETFAVQLARYLGAESILHAGIGGTGFVAGNGGPAGAANNYITRASFVTGKSPNVLIVNGSINDGTSAGSIQAAVESFLAACSTIPKIYVIGTCRSGYEANHDAVRAGALAAGATFIDARGFIYGTGKITTPNATGNADLYIGSDSVHPTIEGHVALGKHCFRQIGWAGLA